MKTTLPTGPYGRWYLLAGPVIPPATSDELIPTLKRVLLPREHLAALRIDRLALGAVHGEEEAASVG